RAENASNFADTVVPTSAAKRSDHLSAHPCDIDLMVLQAGQSVGLVVEIKPAGEVVGEIMRGAQELITRKLKTFCAPCNRTSGFAESAGVAGNPASGQAP